MMKNKIKLVCFLLFVIFISISCRITFIPQIYQFDIQIDSLNWDRIDEILDTMDNKFITLKNDSVLVFWKNRGDVISSIKMKYTLNNNELIIDSIDIYKRFIPEISNVHFLYSNDSLINKKTGEKYFNQKYLDKMPIYRSNLSD